MIDTYFRILFYSLVLYMLILAGLKYIVRTKFDLGERALEIRNKCMIPFLVLWFFTPLISALACVLGIFVLVFLYISLNVILCN